MMPVHSPSLWSKHDGRKLPVIYYKCRSHTAFNLDGAVLAVQWVVVQVHHAGQGGGEPHPIRDAPVAAETNQLVAFRYVVEETEI